MDRRQFLDELQRALSSDLAPRDIQENIEYYNNYIRSEIANGRTEKEVLDELGDPWILARTIKDSKGYGNAQDVVFETTEDGVKMENTNGGSSDKWKKIKGILIAILIIVVVLTIVRGLLRIVLPIAIPLLAVYLIVKIIKKR